MARIEFIVAFARQMIERALYSIWLIRADGRRRSIACGINQIPVAGSVQCAIALPTPNKIDYRPVGSLLLLPPWCAARVVMIGDATRSAPPPLIA